MMKLLRSQVLLACILVCLLAPYCSIAGGREYGATSRCVTASEFYDAGRTDGRACDPGLQLVLLRISNYREAVSRTKPAEDGLDRKTLLEKIHRRQFFRQIDDVLYQFDIIQYSNALKSLDTALNMLDSEFHIWLVRERRELYLVFLSRMIDELEAGSAKDFGIRLGLRKTRKKSIFMQPVTGTIWDEFSSEEIFCAVKHDDLISPFLLVQNSMVFQRCFNGSSLSGE